MMASIDGRIKTERWSLSASAEKQYEAVHALHKADAWMCGRETFQTDFLEQARVARYSAAVTVPKGDFVGPPLKGKGRAKRAYAIAVDASGKLKWESSDMRGDQLVVITTGTAPGGYLADLRRKGISYLLCGMRAVDFRSALRKLAKRFGIKKVMLEGGGRINGAMLAEGLVDEVSLLVCPEADGAQELPTVFDAPSVKSRKRATPLKLVSVTTRPGQVVWLRYKA